MIGLGMIDPVSPRSAASAKAASHGNPSYKITNKTTPKPKEKPKTKPKPPTPTGWTGGQNQASGSASSASTAVR